nr:DNA-binding protein [Prevotella sp.]
VTDVNEVKTALIKSRRIIFTPAVDLKDELANTSIEITCYDRNGEEVKRVTSADEGDVEDPENSSTSGESGESGNSGNSGESGGSGSDPGDPGENGDMN